MVRVGSGRTTRLGHYDWRAASRICSQNYAYAGSLLSRGYQAMKYGKALISGGGSTTRIPVVELAIFAPDASKSQGMEDPSVNATVRPTFNCQEIEGGSY